MDRIDAASIVSALQEQPSQPGFLSLLRSDEGAAAKVPPARGRAQQCSFSATNVDCRRGSDGFDWERKADRRRKPLVGSPASRVRRKQKPRHSPLPFYLQGDARHDSPRALARRHELLKSVRIARAARQFWDTLGLMEHGALSKPQYLQVHCGA